jgi:hypothetical protein
LKFSSRASYCAKLRSFFNSTCLVHSQLIRVGHLHIFTSTLCRLVRDAAVANKSHSEQSDIRPKNGFTIDSRFNFDTCQVLVLLLNERL